MRALLLAVLSLALALFAASRAQAEDFTVNDESDASLGTCASSIPPARCTLRDAIFAANLAAGTDQIKFTPGTYVVLDGLLPPVTEKVTINLAFADATVSGSSTYITAHCLADSDYALDLTNPLAAGSTVSGVPFFALCDRAIKSPVAAPTIAIGPRRADNSVSVSGSAPGAVQVDFFSADGADTGEKEGDNYEFSPPVSGGSYTYPLTPVPAAGKWFNATATGAAGTSGFAQRTRVPDDLVSPSLVAAVAVSNSRVRLDFDEAIGPGSVAPQAFTLAVGDVDRPLTTAGVSGNSVYLDSSLPWLSGETGGFTTTGAGARVADNAGNELLGLPSAAVYAGPGAIDVPLISNFRFSPNRVCRKVTIRCKRARVYVYVTLNKPARVVFRVFRGSKRSRQLVTFVHRLKAGRNKFKMTAVVSGRQLPTSTLTLRATAQDVARSWSVPVDAPFRVVTDKRDL